MQFQVRKPDMHHDHWGLLVLNPDREDCSGILPVIDMISRAQNLGHFFQGGDHGWEPCSGRHFIEFWNLPGDDPSGEQVVNKLIQALGGL